MLQMRDDCCANGPAKVGSQILTDRKFDYCCNPHEVNPVSNSNITNFRHVMMPQKRHMSFGQHNPFLKLMNKL